ncbi:hypothetical protein L332_07905 [Agrococcus pavilionensis RW1]|uniref:Uncharacterized protein n=1 Tax=Agrococcus pavilionensis RW1 TaxID=1330458 RepID=U1MR22_9MICO|nr:hypothetical protein L332_07905 [Agrococcus pavilionensis RW1]
MGFKQLPTHLLLSPLGEDDFIIMGGEDDFIIMGGGSSK